MKKFLSFDVGTTSMKCILYNEKFDELRCVNTEYSLKTNGDSIRCNANVYFDSFVSCVREILENGTDKEEIVSVAFTTQGETFVPVDEAGNPLSDAIVWLDTTASEEAEFIKESIPVEEFYKSTGLCDIDGALPAAKVMHIKETQPELYKKSFKFLFLEDYLIFRLCGRFVSEKSLQSSSGWYDITNETLYDRIFDICKIDKEKIPDILPCGTDLGTINPAGALQTGLSENTHVTTAAMDQISSAIGAQNICEGIFTETTGTALVMGASVKNPDFDISKPVTVYKHYDDSFIYMPYFPTAGIVHKWFRDTLMNDVSKKSRDTGLSAYSLMEEIAKLSPPGSNGVVFNPDFVSGGSINGLYLSTSLSDIVRSVQEGVAYALRELTEVLEQKGLRIESLYSMGGGAKSNFWCRIKSSVLGKSVKVTDRTETTALGAAVLSAVAMGYYASVNDALLAVERKTKVFCPDMHEKKTYDKLFEKYKNIKHREV